MSLIERLALTGVCFVRECLFDDYRMYYSIGRFFFVSAYADCAINPKLSVGRLIGPINDSRLCGLKHIRQKVTFFSIRLSMNVNKFHTQSDVYIKLEQYSLQINYICRLYIFHTFRKMNHLTYIFNRFYLFLTWIFLFNLTYVLLFVDPRTILRYAVLVLVHFYLFILNLNVTLPLYRTVYKKKMLGLFS